MNEHYRSFIVRVRVGADGTVTSGTITASASDTLKHFDDLGAVAAIIAEEVRAAAGLSQSSLKPFHRRRATERPG